VKMWTAPRTRPHSPTTTATATGALPHAGNARHYRDQERQRTLAAGGALKTTLQTHRGLRVGRCLMATAWVKGCGERHIRGRFAGSRASRKVRRRGSRSLPVIEQRGLPQGVLAPPATTVAHPSRLPTTVVLSSTSPLDATIIENAGEPINVIIDRCDSAHPGERDSDWCGASNPRGGRTHCRYIPPKGPLDVSTETTQD